MQDTETRYHALDNLRAIMMWLGVVLHVSMNYVTIPFPLPMRDERTTRLADLMVVTIHSFRMPVFFIIAGFLAAMLLQRRGPAGFLRHRMLRLALPFALFWPFISIATGLAILAFLNRMWLGRWGLDVSVLPPDMRSGASTAHLWFLWVLIWFSVAAAALSLLPRGPFVLAAGFIARLAKAWWGFAALTVPLVLAGTGYDRGLIVASGKFLLPWQEWLHNATFFAFGLALWIHRDTLLPHYERTWRRYAGAGLAVFLLVAALQAVKVPWPLFSAAYNALAWLWGFAWIGLGLRVLGSRNATLAYLADSAYWVYLLHLPVAIGVAAVLYQQPLPALVKILLDIAVTTAVCLASYELLVRHTWVGVLLNGKRHARHGLAAPQVPATP